MSRHVCEYGQRRLRHPQGLGEPFARGDVICKYCTTSSHHRHFGSVHTLLTLLRVPDSLCAQCLASLDVLDYHEAGVLQLGLSQGSHGCRLCALLLARFRATATASVFEIEYRMIPRYGYFIRVFDIVFCPVGAKDWRTNVVRLGIQKEKQDPSQSQLVSIPSE